MPVKFQSFSLVNYLYICIIDIILPRNSHKFQWKRMYVHDTQLSDFLTLVNRNVRPLAKLFNFMVYKILSSKSRTTWTPKIIRKKEKKRLTLYSWIIIPQKRCYLLKYIVLSWREYISRCRKFWILEFPLKRSLAELIELRISRLGLQ